MDQIPNMDTQILLLLSMDVEDGFVKSALFILTRFDARQLREVSELLVSCCLFFVRRWLTYLIIVDSFRVAAKHFEI